MNDDISSYSKLSESSNIPLADILLISLNYHGIKTELNHNRVRFTVKLDATPNLYYIGVCSSDNTPFRVINSDLYFKTCIVGKIAKIENDTCDETYFRRNNTSLTINSNSRSTCRGCRFCGTSQLTKNDTATTNNKKNIKSIIKNILKSNCMSDLSELKEIAVCTGCFKNEKEISNHLIELKKIASDFNFDGEIKYIGSQIRSLEVIDEIIDKVKHFSYYMTLEVFDKRKELLRWSKSDLALDQAINILEYVKGKGQNTSFLYILGVEELDNLKFFYKLKKSLTRFPVVNIFQIYKKDQEILRPNQANSMLYYIKARKMIEQMFQDTNLRPRSWENYRGLWYEQFNEEVMKSIKI